MADGCPTIQLEKINARIEVSSFVYTTPGRLANSSGDVMSFSINKARGQPVGTLQCQVIAWVNDNPIGALSTAEDNLGDVIIVSAGVGDDLARLFTGYITGVRQTPHWNDARKYILDISAEDVFAKMKYGKFSRRFKTQDDPYAVITGGHRRQGANLTRLKRIPAGHKGVNYIHGTSAGAMEHSPLIKTPDHISKSPKGVTPGLGGSRGTSTTGQYRVEPRSTTVYPGATVSVQIIDQATGEPINPQELETLSGKGCLCHLTSGKAQPLAGGGEAATGLVPGEKYFPCWFEWGDNNSLVFHIVGAVSPIGVTFVHPLDSGTASIEFEMVPPHDHSNMGRGGPGVAVFDTFGI
jgi:hypothetical protein